MEKVFQLKKNGTNVRTEIVAGLTTFMTMAYIIALNPNLLTGFAVGTPLWNGVFLATCIASAIGTICMAFLANKPFAMAPGMGLNSFFAVVVSSIVSLSALKGAEMSYTEAFQTALVIIFVEGLVFIVLSLFNVREKIVEAIPLGVRLGIGPAIGLMLMNIGLGSNVSLYGANGGPFFAMRDFFGALTASYAKETMGDVYPQMVLAVVTMFFGLFVIVALSHKKVKGSVLYGMLAASVLHWAGQAIFLHVNPFEGLKTASFVPPFADMAETTLFKLNFAGVAQTSTVTTFVESASGVEAGGRTGLTALTTGILFLLCIFIAPIAAIIPGPATSAALIYVGILMLSNLKKIDFEDITQMLPVAIMLLAMPISGSIGHGIGLALISYTIIKLCTGKGKEVSVLTYVLSLIFLVKFFLAI